MKHSSRGFAFTMGLGVTMLLWAPPAHAVIGMVCTSDAACPVGYGCSKTSSAERPAPGPNPTDVAPENGTRTPVDPTTDTTPAPVTATLVCAPLPQPCATDTDCGLDTTCAIPPRATCASDQPCPAVPAPTGTCEPARRECVADGDCPAPLVCKAQSSVCSSSASVTPLPDGGSLTTTTPTTCTPRPSVCTWVIKACDTATGCARPDEECVDSGWLQAHCAESCDAAWCTQTCEPGPLTGKGMCFPKYVDCSAGQACPAGAGCVDFAGTREGLPPWWSNGNAMKACLPDGIRMVFENKAGSDSSAVDRTKRGTDTIGTTGNTSLDTPIPGPGDAGGAGAPIETSPTANGKDGGCGLGGGGGGLAACLASLGLLGFRRRRDQ